MKTLILERGRKDRSDKFWQLNFGMRPAEERYDLFEPEPIKTQPASPE
jgi:N-sulfoglucosamine sulfohydrolase